MTDRKNANFAKYLFMGGSNFLIYVSDNYNQYFVSVVS